MLNRILVISFADELEKILSIINKEKSEIVQIITIPTDNFQTIISKHKLNCGVAFYDSMPEIVQQKYFDYVIVSDIIKDAGSENRIVKDLKRVGVPAEKILNLSHFASFPFFSIFNALKNFSSVSEAERSKINFFVTGVSHAYAGTDIKEFSMQGMNLALTSQDLFFDYELAKIVLKNKFVKSNQKFNGFFVIGVAPFSLNYDLSQGVNSDRVFGYYPLTKTLHNHWIDEKILFELFNDAYIKSYDLFDTEISFDGCYRSCTQNKDFFIDDFINIRTKLVEATRHSKTVDENKKILTRYVSKCLESNFLPLLVIYPLSEFYNKYFSSRQFEELRYFLSDLSEKFQIPFYDYSADERFNISDFFDIEHLNVRGAKKFSGILNEKLLQLAKERK